MKRTILLPVAVTIAAGSACAQSSVTLFGLVDATIAYGTAAGAGSGHRLQLTNSGNASSRLGFRGTEDLGGGMAASFWLESAISNDDGRAGGSIAAGNQAITVASNAGLNFSRRATVSLSGGMGELRLGRDYTPQFWNLAIFDPFGVNGVGTNQALVSSISGVTAARASNTIGYLLPQNLGGFYGQAQYYLGENASNAAGGTSTDGTGTAARVGYESGPLNVALAVSRTRYAAGDVRANNVAVMYDLGVAKLMGVVSRDTNGTTRGRGALIGALFPAGVGEVRVAYSRYTTDLPGTATDPSTSKAALGYVYNLSKRSALYGTYAIIHNKSGAALTLNNAVAGGPNQSSSGVDLGIRHTF
jgi:predicted porin